MKSTILLLGCSGEVGSRLASLLFQAGHKVYGIRGSKTCTAVNRNHSCIKRNLMEEDIDELILQIKPQILIHTSWVTSSNHYLNSEENYRWLKVSKEIITTFKNTGGEYVVVTGSCAEYSWIANSPLSERSLTSNSSAYSEAKLDLLEWLERQELPYLWTRTFFQFGLNEPSERIVPSLIDALLRGIEYRVNEPDNVRDFIFIEDLVAIIRKLIESRQQGIFNIGTGTGVSIRQLVLQLEDLLLCGQLVSFDTPKSPPSIVVSDPSKLIAAIGDYQFNPLSDSLRKSIESRLQNNRF
jgi:UDP-glucuronate decarboxylase